MGASKGDTRGLDHGSIRDPRTSKCLGSRFSFRFCQDFPICGVAQN